MEDRRQKMEEIFSLRSSVFGPKIKPTFVIHYEIEQGIFFGQLKVSPNLRDSIWLLKVKLQTDEKETIYRCL